MDLHSLHEVHTHCIPYHIVLVYSTYRASMYSRQCIYTFLSGPFSCFFSTCKCKHEKKIRKIKCSLDVDVHDVPTPALARLSPPATWAARGGGGSPVPLVIFTHRIASIHLAIQSLTLLCTTDVRTNFPSVLACDEMMLTLSPDCYLRPHRCFSLRVTGIEVKK